METNNTRVIFKLLLCCEGSTLWGSDDDNDDDDKWRMRDRKKCSCRHFNCVYSSFLWKFVALLYQPFFHPALAASVCLKFCIKKLLHNFPFSIKKNEMPGMNSILRAATKPTRIKPFWNGNKYLLRRQPRNFHTHFTCMRWRKKLL